MFGLPEEIFGNVPPELCRTGRRGLERDTTTTAGGYRDRRSECDVLIHETCPKHFMLQDFQSILKTFDETGPTTAAAAPTV